MRRQLLVHAFLPEFLTIAEIDVSSKRQHFHVYVRKDFYISRSVEINCQKDFSSNEWRLRKSVKKIQVETQRGERKWD